ncbi:hypothetical protein [Streptomyces sp. enrichment culture]|uniref:hypothetical protein n=1 Tax=Streptomyces sp. enrichment culture TaxID=1795815 RepID=UPI003F574E3E
MLRLKELLLPSIADVAVLSVDVSTAIVRVDATCTANGAACPTCEVGSNQVHGRDGDEEELADGLADYR